jgi:aryl sulfotransferase
MASDLRLPERTRQYRNWCIDSIRWDYVKLRGDDIIVTTSYKAGTTWMQGIIANLIFAGKEPLAPIGQLSPFVELRIVPLEIVLAEIDQQRHRRFLKTHLPIDAFPFNPRLKYVYVGRDPRDVFMSLWNHHCNYSAETTALMNTLPGRVGDGLPPCPSDIHAFWRDWITRGWFEWESDGYPYWSHHYHVQSWWNFRHLENILFVHYADLLTDLEGGMRRVADFLEIEVPESAWPTVVRNCTFAEMKAHGTKYMPVGADTIFKGGADTFFHKGTNNRWREVLSKEELSQYNVAAARAMKPECRRWLENGGQV